MSNENCDRICSEPYTSLVSLEISLDNLHTNHFVQFNEKALSRNRQSIQDLKRSFNIVEPKTESLNRRFKSSSGMNIQHSAESNSINENQRSRSIDQQPFEPGLIQEHSKPALKLAPEIEEPDLIKCPRCRWPRPRSHLNEMHSSQVIQLNWIRENLLPTFEQNVSQVRELAFKHGLWYLFLKCLAFENEVNDYITCCLMLDDVRLLNSETSVLSKCGSKEKFVDIIMTQLSSKNFERNSDNNDDLVEHCFKCGCELIEVGSYYEYVDNPDEICFNVVNLFEGFILRLPEVDLRQTIHSLLEHPKLVEVSKIPASFYLKVVSTSINNQSASRI